MAGSADAPARDAGAAHLNSAVIRLTITKNITLELAYRLLGLLWTNKTGKTTTFAFFATSEFYTLGFAKDVRDLFGNVAVVNTWNWTVPDPPPSPGSVPALRVKEHGAVHGREKRRRA